MTETVIVPIILGVIASGGLWTLIQYLINRKDSKNDTLKSIKDKVDEIERNIKKSQTFRGQFSHNLKWQISDPLNNIGVGSLILFGIVIIWVILEILH